MFAKQRINLPKLRNALTERFSDGDLRTLCFDLEVDYDDLPGTSKADKARELIVYLGRRSRTPDIIAAGKQLRPDVPWDDVIEAQGGAQPGAPARAAGGAYSLIIVTDQVSFANDVQTAVERFFATRQIPRATVSPVISTCGLEPEQWSAVLGQALRQLTDLRARYEEVHLLSAAFWLWNLALGAEIADRHPLSVYHYQNSTLHLIWRASREIKDRKAAANFAYTICEKPRLHQPGSREDAAAVIFAIGAPQIVPNAASYVQANLPDLPVWVVSTPNALDPAVPEQWQMAAAELAHALDEISGGGRRELWLCGTAPAALSLMVGTAVGRYRRLHLLHFLPAERTYRELLSLPWS